MKKSYIVLAIIVIIAIGIFAWFQGSYNQMVTRSETISSQWSNAENQYQRRADLIPNLVNTVKGCRGTRTKRLGAGTSDCPGESRSNAESIFDQLDEKTLQKFNNMQGELSSALSRLMAISEQYPDLKANRDFQRSPSPIGRNRKPYCRGKT